MKVQVIELVVFALVAAYLIYRLRNVLGRRHGEERQRPNPFVATPDSLPNGRSDLPDNLIILPDRRRMEEPAAAPPDKSEPRSVAAGLDEIRLADPDFDEKHFLRGARAAFTQIVESFAAGDAAALRPLLSDEVYDRFAAAIRERQAAGKTLETRIERLQDADIVAAGMEGRDALITVQFVSQQSHQVLDAQGQRIEAESSATTETTDTWTFRRNTRARDPNWQLVETRDPA